MKVLQVIDSLGLGGAEVLLAQLHAPFRERGIECAYYILRSRNSVLESRLHALGARIYAPLNASEYSPLHVLPLCAHLRTHQYDIVHVHLFPAQLWAAVAAWVMRPVAVIVTTEHNTINRRRTVLWHPVDRFLYRQYAHIACISKATLMNMIEWLPELTNKVLECPNGIDVDEFASATALDRSVSFSGLGAERIVLSVGRLEAQKDQQTLLHAMNLVPKAHLVIVGTGPLGDELCLLAKELGISDRVHFLGLRTDVSQLLKTADVYVQPSKWEGFGIATVEAMASGLPVIASDVPGLAEVVGGDGILFPPGDHLRLAECLNLLLGDSELRSRLSHAAQKRAQEFRITRTRDCYEQLYRKALLEIGRRDAVTQ